MHTLVLSNTLGASTAVLQHLRAHVYEPARCSCGAPSRSFPEVCIGCGIILADSHPCACPARASTRARWERCGLFLQLPPPGRAGAAGRCGGTNFPARARPRPRRRPLPWPRRLQIKPIPPPLPSVKTWRVRIVCILEYELD